MERGCLFSPLVMAGARLGQDGWGRVEGRQKGVDESILEMLVNALVPILIMFLQIFLVSEHLHLPLLPSNYLCTV